MPIEVGDLVRLKPPHNEQQPNVLKVAEIFKRRLNIGVTRLARCLTPPYADASRFEIHPADHLVPAE